MMGNKQAHSRQLLPGVRSNRNLSSRKKMTANVIRVHGNRCIYCGAKAETIDHITPLAQGGYDIFENLVPSCKDCNASKGSMGVKEWIDSGLAPEFDPLVLIEAILLAHIDIYNRTKDFR